MKIKVTWRVIVTLLIFLSIIQACKKDGSQTNNNLTDERTFGFLPESDSALQMIPVVDTTFLFSRRLASLPTDFSLDMPPILSQGGEGSCVAFATGYAARSYLLHRDDSTSYLSSGTLDNNVILSPEYIYNSAKQPGECRTAGMYFSSAFNLIKTEGVSTWASMPYSSINGCSTLPNPTQKANAANYKINSYYRLTDISPDYIKRILFNNNPILIGIKVDYQFWTDGKFIWKTNMGSYVGGHAIVICGWDDTKNAYKIMNSWGTNWGFNGFGWIDYNYLANVLQGHVNYYSVYVMKTNAVTPTSIPTLTTTNIISVTTTNASGGGNISSDGGASITARGVCWSTSSNPTTSNSKTSNGTGTGSFTSTITGLAPNTTYYVRAYATNSIGNAYGNQLSFSTTASATLPTLSTTSVSSITSTTASSGGNISNQGSSSITSRGVCWSTSSNPTIANSKTTDGSGIGSFTSNITSLSPSTTYYVRAYATNNTGTAYGNQLNFTTSGSTANCGTVTDIDGNVYNTVTIGTQCWMKENLKTSRYRDGTLIGEIEDTPTWENIFNNNTQISAWCFYNKDVSNNAIYGKLYNWFAATNSKNICPIGWHIPDTTEWNILTNYLGGLNLAGGAMKATNLWNAPNTGATNISGFTGLPSGYRYASNAIPPEFKYFGEIGSFWTINESNSRSAYIRELQYANSKIVRGSTNKEAGISVRCIKN